MKIETLRKEIRELQDSLLYKCEPAHKVFIFGGDDDSSLTEADIEVYRQAHPHTRVIVLFRRDCGSGGSE